LAKPVGQIVKGATGGEKRKQQKGPGEKGPQKKNRSERQFVTGTEFSNEQGIKGS